MFYACCFPDGSCAELLLAECLAMGGVPADFGVSCADACGQGVPTEIPALSRAGVAVLISLIAITAALVLRRRA